MLALLVAGATACGVAGTTPSARPTPRSLSPSTTASAAPTATSASPRFALMLDFEDGPGPGEPVRDVTNRGTAPVTIATRTPDGAPADTVLLGAEAADGGRAVRFPRFSGAPTASAAALVVVPGTPDALDPGDRDFTVGASFRLDPESSGSAADDGDNLLQRGTFSSTAQVKVQIDDRVPSCRVAGSGGTSLVRADSPVEPGRWYTVTCSRDGGEVRLDLTRRGEPGARTWKVAGPTGTVSLAGLPLSVGAKVTPAGVPVASADQFNGLVDDVFWRFR